MPSWKEAPSGGASGSYQPASATLDTLAALTPGAAGLALLEDGNAADVRETADLGSSATLDTSTAAPTGATARVLAAFEWDFCAASAIADMVTNPPAGCVWEDTTHVTVSRNSSGEITWIRSATSRSEDRATGAFPHFSVPVQGPRWRVVLRMMNASGGAFRCLMIGQRIGTSFMGGMADFNDSGTRKVEVWNGSPVSSATYGGSDIPIWIRVDCDDEVVVYYSTATAEPAADDFDTVAANGWVAVGSFDLPSFNGRPRLAIGTFDASTFGHTITFYALRVTGW